VERQLEEGIELYYVYGYVKLRTATQNGKNELKKQSRRRIQVTTNKKRHIVTCDDLLERGETSHGHGERKDKEKRSHTRGGHPVKTQGGANGLNDTFQERVVEDHLGKKKQ